VKKATVFNSRCKDSKNKEITKEYFRDRGSTSVLPPLSTECCILVLGSFKIL